MSQDPSKIFQKAARISLRRSEFEAGKAHLMQHMIQHPLTPSPERKAAKHLSAPLSVPLYFGAWSGSSMFRVLRPFAMRTSHKA